MIELGLLIFLIAWRNSENFLSSLLIFLRKLAGPVLLFQLWSLKNRKIIKKKTDRNCWYAWAPYNLSFLWMEKQRLRISAALNLATHKISFTQDVIACRISAAVDVILCRISAALDVKACRIFARFGRQTLQNFCSTGRQTLQNFCITVRSTMSNKNEKKTT